MDLDDVVPAADHVTRQERWIDAPPAVVWEELHQARVATMPVTMVLGGIRALPGLLTGKWRGALDRTFLDVVPIPLLSSEPPRAVVYGGVLQPWHLTGGEQAPHLDAAALRRWATPGWVKVAMEFRLTPERDGTTLSSETRIRATDPESRRRFARYWLLVRPGSSALRWELLTAVEVRAEARV